MFVDICINKRNNYDINFCDILYFALKIRLLFFIPIMRENNTKKVHYKGAKLYLG